MLIYDVESDGILSVLGNTSITKCAHNIIQWKKWMKTETDETRLGEREDFEWIYIIYECR